MKGAQPLLIPGNMCDARMWDGGGRIIRRSLERLTGHAPRDADLAGLSSIEAMAQRALAACEGPILAVGFSMGAIVAARMALIAPKRVAGLVLAGFNAGADLPSRAAARPGQQAAARAGRLREVVIEQLKPHYLAGRNRHDQALRCELVDMALGLGPEVFVAQSEALRLREDLTASLGALACPVLYIVGEEDALCPPAWHAEWQRRTPRAALEVLPGAGHMAPLERPHAFSATLAAWFVAHTERLAA